MKQDKEFPGWMERTVQLLGKEKVERLQNAHVLVAGLGGVGSAGKVDATKIRIADFKKTYNCRLAFFLRKKLRKLDITGGFRVVFSSELVEKSLILATENEHNKKSIVGTVSYIPAIFGNMLASIVIEDISLK